MRGVRWPYMKQSVEIGGIQEHMEAFKIGPKHALRISHAANHYVAGIAAKRMRQYVPVDTKLLRKSIKTKKLRQRKDSTASSIYINLGSSREAKDGAYYWRFVDKGTRLNNWPVGVDFTERARREAQRDAPRIYREKVVMATNRLIIKRAGTRR